RIVLCGFSTDQIAIGNVLADAGFYFQHPSSLEYGSKMQYCNPHYLLRPGSQMPALETFVETNSDRRMEQKLLDESTKGRFMNLFDEAGDIDTKTTAEPSSRLKSTMKEHQISALTWMIGVEAGTIRDGFPSLWELSSDSSSNKYRHKITGSLVARPELAPGGVLADEMGLGKTLSMLALICSTLDAMETEKNESEEMLPRQSRTTLIVTPKTTIHSWQQQCESHIHQGKIKTAVCLGSDRKKSRNELQSSDIVFTTYETMRRDWAEKGPLFTHSWYRVILDEGMHHQAISESFANNLMLAHHIRTRKSQTFEAACELQAWYRWCLTGTPIHNCVDDFAALLSFIRVPLFANKKTFDFWITTPIREKSSYGLQRLSLLIKNTCLRRTKKSTELSDQLPNRREETVWVELLPRDRDLHSFFYKEAAKIASGFYRHKTENSTSNYPTSNILKLIIFLRLICNHGEKLLPPLAVGAWKAAEGNAFDWQIVQDFQQSCEIWQHSSKLSALIDNLRQEQSCSDRYNPIQPIKSVVFSSWTKMIGLTQQCLEANGFVCARIDGQLSLERRMMAMKQFNSDPRCTVMLATIGSAGEGVDFTAANNVHLLEPHWNPMIESQAVNRVHRIGQSREVRITRYITKDTIETYVQSRQQDKLKL
ncbi:hypothetical protein TRIATDRAFT_172559, partial [Trichoderma atroviride IMI 206040]